MILPYSLISRNIDSLKCKQIQIYYMNLGTTTPYGLSSDDLKKRVEENFKTNSNLYKYIFIDSIDVLNQFDSIIKRNKRQYLFNKKKGTKHGLDVRMLAVAELTNGQKIIFSFGTTIIMKVNDAFYKRDKKIFLFFLYKVRS